MRKRSRPNLLPTPDPGWLFLFAGLAILAAAVLIPAAEALDEARYARDRALVAEQHRIARLERHSAYLGALHERQPALIAQLRAIQLNKYAEGMRPLGTLDIDPGRASASVFEMLEPPLPALPPEPPHRAQRSTLAKLATGESARLWLIAIGALSILLGALPPASARRRKPRPTPALPLAPPTLTA